MKLQNCHGNIPYVSAPRWRQSFKILYNNEDVRALKDAVENLETRKSTPRKILTGILSKNSENSEVKPNLSCKLLRAWSSPRCDKTSRLQLGNNFTCVLKAIFGYFVYFKLVCLFSLIESING